jgi:hypothetical protein
VGSLLTRVDVPRGVRKLSRLQFNSDRSGKLATAVTLRDFVSAWTAFLRWLKRRIVINHGGGECELGYFMSHDPPCAIIASGWFLPPVGRPILCAQNVYPRGLPSIVSGRSEMNCGEPVQCVSKAKQNHRASRDCYYNDPRLCRPSWNTTHSESRTRMRPAQRGIGVEWATKAPHCSVRPLRYASNVTVWLRPPSSAAVLV